MVNHDLIRKKINSVENHPNHQTNRINFLRTKHKKGCFEKGISFSCIIARWRRNACYLIYKIYLPFPLELNKII